MPHFQGRYCDKIVEEDLSYSDVERYIPELKLL
jgi:hypothetical protein